MISNDSQYVYRKSHNGMDLSLAAKKVSSEDDVLYGEKNIAVDDWEDFLSDIDKYYNYDPYHDNYCSVEDLSFDDIEDLFTHYDYSNIPTTELQKWFDSHGIKASINDVDAGYFIRQEIKFNYEGKDYEWLSTSYEVVNTYDYKIGVRNDGTGVQNPIYVTNAQELRTALEKNPDGNIILKNDIDLAGMEWEPIPEFSGVLYGGDHTIKNLSINGDGECVGFIGFLKGGIQDVTFDNATVTNVKTEYGSYAGIVAGKIEPPYKGGNCVGATGLEHVNVNNSSVKGGACAGILAGAAISPNVVLPAVRSCNVKDSTVSGDYASGGMLGYANSVRIEGYSHVNGVIINGGQWAGGIIGSADNEFYKDSNNTLQSYIECNAFGINYSNITINGGYHGEQTLGAGGLCGRLNAPDKETYDTKCYGLYYCGNTDVNINNAYADGSIIGWVCEIDPETGVVIKNNDNPTGKPRESRSSFYLDTRDDLNQDESGLVGKAGTTESDTIKEFGLFIPISDQLLSLDKFAQENNLESVPNMRGVYKDSNNVYYFVSSDGHIRANDKEHAIEAYKAMFPEGERERNDAVESELADTIAMPEYMYILQQLGAVNAILKDYDTQEATGLPRGTDTFQEVFYQLPDGSWHKLTTSVVGFIRNPYDPSKSIDKDKVGTFTFEEYISECSGTPETIKLCNKGDNGRYCIPQNPHFCIEDLSYEEVFAQISNNTPEQPPYNSGFNGTEENGYVQTIQEPETDVNGIDLDPNPENATYQDYKEMLVLYNFLNDYLYQNMYPRGEIVYNSMGANTSYYDLWTTLPNGVQLTEKNWQQYKDLIPMLDKEQAIEKAFDKLFNNSFQIFGSDLSIEDGTRNLMPWVSELLSAMGATGLTHIKSGMTDELAMKHGTNVYVLPDYISFKFKGKNYKLAIPATAEGFCPPDSAICSKEEVEELRKYVSAEEYEKILEYYFTPLQSINGEAQTYMFSYDNTITGYKYKTLVQSGKETPSLGIQFTENYLGHDSRGYNVLLDYLKTHELKDGYYQENQKSEAEYSTKQTSSAPAMTAPLQEEIYESDELISPEDYKKDAEDNIEALQKKVGNVIKDGDSYYNSFNGKQYNYMWDPFNHKWLAYEPSQIVNGVAKDQNNPILVRIQMIVAALAQGLSFTANPKVCKDKDGNVYEFNEVSCAFEKQA